MQEVANFYERNIQTFVELNKSCDIKPDYIHHEYYTYNKDTPVINILLIRINENIRHALAVSNSDRLTTYKACPKCHDCINDVTEKQAARDFDPQCI
jgi:hypothetical protein